MPNSSSGSVSGASGRLPAPRPAPTSASGRLPTAAGSASGQLGRSGELPNGRPRGGPMSAGPASVSGQAPAYRPRRLLSIGLLVLVLTVVGIVVGRSLTNERSVVSSGGSLPTHYQMACRACGQRFELEVEAFRRALATRENRTANRIPCPKCGEKDAAYRVESGMAGMGELSPAGQGSINPRFPGSSEESPNPPE